MTRAAALSFLGAILAVPAMWPDRALSQAGAPVPPADELPPRLQDCLMADRADAFVPCAFSPFIADVAELEEALRNAGPTDIFFVSLELDEPARLGRVRDLAIQLQIPRALASPEMISANGTPVALPGLGIGTLYEDLDAWPREACEARVIAAIFGVPASAAEAPETWPVRRLDVTGSAFAIQQLLDGSFLPRARLIRGMGQQGPFVEALKQSIAREVAEPVMQVANASVPSGCQAFAQQEGGRVEFRESSSIPTGNGTIIHMRGDGNSRLVQELANLPPDAPLQLGIQFEDAVTIEMLSDFVARYSIDFMVAMLHAKDAPTRVALTVELGIRSGPMADQVRYFQCKLSAQAQADPSFVDARASNATIFLDTASTWPLLSDSNFRSLLLTTRISSSQWTLMQSTFSRSIADRRAWPIGRLDECID